MPLEVGSGGWQDLSGWIHPWLPRWAESGEGLLGQQTLVNADGSPWGPHEAQSTGSWVCNQQGCSRRQKSHVTLAGDMSYTEV